MKAFIDAESASKTNNSPVDAEDCLTSKLPECLLLENLALLPLKQAVMTGILSRQWRGLWTQVTTLRLDYVELMSKPAIVLPYVRKLHLCLHDSLIGTDPLRESFPLLEDLNLDGNFEKGAQLFFIKAPNLTKLCINFRSKDDNIKFIVLTAPKCKYLRVYVMFKLKLHVFGKQLCHLHEAEISSNSSPSERVDRLELMRNQLAVISRVKVLKLDHSVITGVLQYFDSKDLRTFDQLIDLSVSILQDNVCLKAVSGFLRICPKLETLSIKVVPLPETNNSYVSWVGGGSCTPLCLPMCIKMVEVWLMGVEQEVELIRYLLSNACALKRLVVRFSKHGCKQVFDKLCSLPYKSSFCSVEFIIC